MSFFINAVIMAGGLGTRLSPYKVILEICEKPMIKWVFDTLTQIVDRVYIALSRDRVINNMVQEMFPKNNIIFTSGRGYESDVLEAVKRVGTPVLVFPADTPFIKRDIISELVLNCDKSICTLICKNGYIGISMWKELDFSNYKDVFIDEEIINVNTIEDYIKANKICKHFIT